MSDDVRRVLHSAYSFVRSVESNKAISALTLDHMIQAQINRLKKGTTTDILDAAGESLGDRPSRWDQLDALEQEVQSVVNAIEQAGSDPAKLSALGLEPESNGRSA